MQSDGCTLREHLESLAKQRARSGLPPPEELTDAECPEAAEYLWRWFLEISRRRSAGGFSVNPISYAEVEAWSRLTHTRPSSMEVEWMLDLDDARAAATNKEAPPPARAPSKNAK